MDPFRAATARAEATRRVLSALDRAGFRELVAPELDDAEGLARTLGRLVPRGVRLPQRLAVVSRTAGDGGRDVLLLVVHDGSAPALEVELPAVVAEALGSLGAGGFALTLRSLGLARSILQACGLDPAHVDRFLEELGHASDHTQGPAPELVAAGATLVGTTLVAGGTTLVAGGTTSAVLEPAELEAVILGLLGRLRFRAYGTRTPREVAARLASRLGSALPSVTGKVRAARAVLERLSKDSHANASLAGLEGVVAAVGLAPEAIRPLADLVTTLERLGLPPAALELGADAGGPGPVPGTRLEPSWRLDSLGVGRVAWGGGLDFEGGRAAVAGLTLGALARGEDLGPAPSQVLVVPVSGEELAPAHALAREARAAGLRVELDPSGRNLRSALRAASRSGVALVAILGEREVKEGTVLLKDLAREEQRSAARAGVVAELVAFFARPRTAPVAEESAP